MSDNTSVAQGLAKVLADAYTLYLKTHNFHWNVTGANFNALHTMFETQYTDLALAVDELAERIRALGEFAPGSYREFSELSSIDEATGRTKALDMVRMLADDNEAICETMKAVIDTAESAGDVPTADMLIARIQIHQKNAWMLRATLDD